VGTPDARRPAPVARAAGGRRLHVLLAEDNPINQQVAKRILEQQGHTVTVACDGRAAADLAAQHAFDVVLMDVQMPEMDGFEATAAIRARERTTGAHVPIVALTAHAMRGDRERCLDAGMDAYLSKPVRRLELQAVLESLLPPVPCRAGVQDTAALAAVGGGM
jgi:CheY-like chemotaxis protein